jgi:hypothetical protein
MCVVEKIDLNAREKTRSDRNNNAIKIHSRKCFNEFITINSINKWHCDLGVGLRGASECFEPPRLSTQHFLVRNRIKVQWSKESGFTTLSVASIAVFEACVVTHRQHVACCVSV